MLVWRTIGLVCCVASARKARAVCPDCAFLLATLLIVAAVGCETPKQERFRENSDEGVHLYQRGNFAGAREHFELALELEPKDANVLYNLGQCHDRLGEVEAATSYYQKCLEIQGNHAECRHAMAVLLYRSGRRGEADQMIQGWLASEPSLAAAYVEDGWRLRQRGDFQLAVGRFQQALHQDPRNVRALTELGQIHEENQRPDLALVMYQRALESNPQHFELASRVNQLKSKGVRPPLPD